MQRIKMAKEYIQQYKEMFCEPPSAIGMLLSFYLQGKKNESKETIPSGKTNRLLSSSPYGFDSDIGYWQLIPASDLGYLTL